MGTEIRPCRPDEMDAYGKIIQYVFAENDPEGVTQELATTQPDWTTCGFVDDRLACTMGVFPFTVRLNGASVSMGGVTAVGTLPSYRRRGLLRQVMTRGFETMRERRQSYAILWASMAAIYQRFGYGLAASQVKYTFDPRFATFETPYQPAGSISMETSEDAYPAIKRLYIEWATPRNLPIHRSAPLWQASTLRPPKKDYAVYVAIYRDPAGEPRGHLVYSTHEEQWPKPGPGQTLTVMDFIALDMDAYRALWEYIRGHDLVGKVVMRNALGEDDPAPDLLLEPRNLSRHTSDAIWMRIVDVEQALAQRPYGSRGDLTIAIPADECCPWNAGTYLLETDGPSAMVSRTGRKPDLTMRPNSLATLLAGHRSATHLARAGLLDAAGAGALQAADAIFRTEYRPHCPNGF